MWPRVLFLLVLLGLATLRAASAPAVSEILGEWQDAARNRTVPYKIYYPAAASRPLPVIVMSHGLGGSREGYSYLGRHWAEKGFVAVHLQHAGSDGEILKQGQPMKAMREAIRNLENSRNRPLDVSLAADRLAQMSREGALKGRLDPQRLGVAGHSFGAFTALAVAGQVFVMPGGKTVSLGDPRFQAAVALSAPIPRKRGAADLKEAFGAIRIPAFVMTGTEDKTPFDTPGTEPWQRRLPFDGMAGPHKYLLILDGADHMTFAGARDGLGILRGRKADPEREARYRALIEDGTTAFFNAWLKDDAAARKWLAGGGYQAEVGRDGTFEVK